ncbi:hypothetical protein DL764_003460 [Monosporascus ibericus]|uniref:Uncharacterized protein n=1 Tax=Monosporascus ibericus TaxID=155417 RepID=A0A4Q4TGG3_9PEZI|nr:hypothetical protein DL764_003460 [Monosporascus ibericus]
MAFGPMQSISLHESSVLSDHQNREAGKYLFQFFLSRVMSHSEDIFVIGTPVRTGVAGTHVTLGLNLKTPVFAKALQQAARADANLMQEVASADSEVREYLIRHLGEDVVRGPSPEEQGLLSKLYQYQKKIGTTINEAPTTVEKNFSRPLSSQRGAERSASVAADSTRLSASLNAYEGGRFDMIVALSQWLLNKSVEVIHNSTPSRQVLNFQDPFYSVGFNNAELLPPQIAIDVASETTDSRGRAIYYLRFGKNGSCTLRKDSTFVELPTKDWVFAFSVEISLIDIDKNSAEYSEVVGKFGTPGDYRITRLLANLETADIISPIMSECTFGDVEDQMQGAVFLSFQILMLNWVTIARQEGHGLLGYSLSVNDQDESQEATFPPTSQQLQAYPHLNEGQSFPVTSVGAAGENNMLVYLNMTQGRSPPSVSKLPYSGNWCTTIERGTMAIGNQLFFEQFLLPRLQKFNEASFLEPLTPSLDVKKPLTWLVGFNDTKGSRGASYFQFGITGNKWPSSTWNWEVTNTKDKTRQQNGMGRVWLTHTIDVKNSVRVEPGNHIVRVDHEMKILQHTKLRYIGTRSGSSTIRRKVTYHIYLESLLEGKLSLRFPGTETIETDIIHEDGFWFDRDYVSDQADNLANELSADQTLATEVSNLSRKIGKQDVFILPGGGYLFMKNPIFNDNADLLTKLEFNGI